jgi:hypothetical protein
MTATAQSAPIPTAGFKGLPTNLIDELLANTRTKNVYGPKLLEFAQSDEIGINPAEAWPMEFGKKKATSLYQGFRNAAEKAGIMNTVLIKLYDDNVYILHKERLALMQNGSDTEDVNDTEDTEDAEDSE